MFNFNRKMRLFVIFVVALIVTVSTYALATANNMLLRTKWVPKS